MKKVFVLNKGIEKFSDQELKNLENITGGLIGQGQGQIIYYPTSGGGRVCPEGQVWSDSAHGCVELDSRLESFRKL